MNTPRLQRQRLLLALTLGLVASWVEPASAAGDGPPESRLEIGNRAQRGMIVAYCWTSTSGTSAVTGCGDGVLAFRRPLRVTTRAASIVYDFPYPVTEFSLDAWPRFQRGELRGRRVRIAVRWSPEISDGRVAWRASFDLPGGWNRVYLVAFTAWLDPENGFARQDALWTYSARVVTPPDPASLHGSEASHNYP